jgi:hypothetical protein
MNTLYSTKVTATGGRHGSKDGLLEMKLALPRQLGGKGDATNPETLFAELFIMILNHFKNFLVSAAAFLVLAGTAVPALAAPVKNIVLVHGAFVDGSGWKGVYDILVKDGYNVTLVKAHETRA